MTRGLAVVVGLLASACSLNPHPMILMVNPTTGQTVTCQTNAPKWGFAWGIGGEVAVENCAKQYEGLGFVRSENLKTVVQAMAKPVAGSGLDGTYGGLITGSLNGNPFSLRVTFTIVQSGNQIVGAWTTTQGTAGTLLGTISGSTVADFRVRQTKPCVADFAGSASIGGAGATLSGSYAGDDCAGQVTASFGVSRQ